ncbi:DUF7322 domain-containing protein [Halosimplex salinum]|uniref:DUF7322 domain-containing protein n=1 Tax=Halosimplex salinum TaxID=1710538 RepID=UPI000F48EEAE|nr:hypothetical protein [Halosimplex salinum]
MSEDADEGDDSLLGNPERFEPSLGPDVPEIEVPSVPEPQDPTDVDPEISRTFWRLVVVFDVAILAMALGPMFVYFRGDWDTGGPMFALGVVTFAYGVLQYRRFRADGE